MMRFMMRFNFEVMDFLSLSTFAFPGSSFYLYFSSISYDQLPSVSLHALLSVDSGWALKENISFVSLKHILLNWGGSSQKRMLYNCSELFSKFSVEGCFLIFS